MAEEKFRLNLNDRTQITESIIAISRLNTELPIKKQALKSFAELTQEEREIGWIGKFLGSKMPNVAIHVAALMCLFLWALVLLNYETRLDVLKLILPVFTLSLGYMFGKNDTK